MSDGVKELTVAIIPARGGSKGIPGKNLQIVAGKPLLLHSIEHAKASKKIDRVYVTTDDPSISVVACEAGAEIIQRPAELSTDYSSSESALLHALNAIRYQEGREPDIVVFLQATSPYRMKTTIDDAISVFIGEQADSLFTACQLEGFLWRNDHNGLRSFSYNHEERPRRQDAPEDLVENGSIYIFKPWVLRTLGNRLGGRISVYRMPWRYSFQIDAPEDLALLDALIRIEYSENNMASSLTS